MLGELTWQKQTYQGGSVISVGMYGQVEQGISLQHARIPAAEVPIGIVLEDFHKEVKDVKNDRVWKEKRCIQ